MSEVALFFEKMHKVFKNKTQGCSTPLSTDFPSQFCVFTVKSPSVTQRSISQENAFKGCGMGPWLVFVSPCFRENVVVTCKIWSFLCSLDNLLQKNVIVLSFGNQISKWRSFEKKEAIFDLLFTFLVTGEKLQKFLQHISHSHNTRILLTLLTFLPYQF